MQVGSAPRSVSQEASEAYRRIMFWPLNRLPILLIASFIMPVQRARLQ
jgi:hypothetical protein